jgi:hypothetical protein
VDRRSDRGQRFFERGAALRERTGHVVRVAEGQQVEGREVGRRLRRQQADPARRRVDALQQGVEVQPLAVCVRDHDLAVDHRALGEVGQHRLDQFREVAGHRPLVPAADLDLGAVPEDDRPEAVPLRLEAVRAVRNLGHRLGQHRRDRRVHW